MSVEAIAGRPGHYRMDARGLKGATVQVVMFRADGYAMRSQTFPLARALGPQSFEIKTAATGPPSIGAVFTCPG